MTLITLNDSLGSVIPVNLFLNVFAILRVNKEFAQIACVIFRCNGSTALHRRDVLSRVHLGI